MPIIVNMEKARDLHLAKIRLARNTALNQLDTPYMMALEQNDESALTSIAKQKQTLRDIPQRIDLGLFRNAEQLETFWPDCLDRP